MRPGQFSSMRKAICLAEANREKEDGRAIILDQIDQGGPATCHPRKVPQDIDKPDGFVRNHRPTG